MSTYIREQAFLWVDVDDEPSAESDRAYVERNVIALLSNFEKEAIDPRDDGWLGRYSQSPEIRQSGLWNVNHVDESDDSEFLDLLAERMETTGTS